MQPEATSAPVRVLTAYSQQRATADEVMRSLTSHRGWLAPGTLFAQSGEEHLFFDRIVLFSTETRLPPGELWMFTDLSAAQHAQAAGALLGPYASGITGTELFSKISPDLKIVRVNPYSPREQGWQFLDGSFDLARLWARAVALEESFAQASELDIVAISKFKAFMFFNHTSGHVITLPNQGGLKNPAVVFTAPDCAAAFLAKLTEEQRASMVRYVADGLTLIKQLPGQQIDGMLFNAFGPGPASVLFFAEIEDVNALYDED